MIPLLGLLGLASAVTASLVAWSGQGLRAAAHAAAAAPLALAAMGLAGLLAPGTAISLLSPFGPVQFHVGHWSGFWIVIFQLMIALAAWVYRSTAGGRPHALSIAFISVAMAGLLSANSPMALVLAWGVLAAGAYATVLSGDRGKPAISAGFAMLALSEVGAGALMLGALLLTLRIPVAPGLVAALGVVGLGSKAGLFPFQTWLPVAEPEAPGVGAGLLSGVATGGALLAMLRWLSWAPADAAVAWGMIALGLLGAVIGAVHAMVDEDFKRVLAYSTVEWVGLILAALGLSIVFAGAGLGTAAALTRDAAIVLILVHSLGKFAAFVTAGWLERALGHRSMDGAGGMLRSAPWLGGAVLLAVAVLMTMPPTGGYVGEWMSAEGVFAAASSSLHGVLVVAGIAAALVVGAGASATFRWFSALFLGPVRMKPLVPPARAEVTAVAAAAVIAAAAGPAVQWLIPWISAYAPDAGARVAADIVAPTFTKPSAVAPLVKLGGGIFSWLPGVRGVILFPGGFTATSPWDLLIFGGMLVALVALGARALRRASALRAARTVSPWAGGVDYGTKNAWTAMGTAHPLRLAFSGLIRLQRERIEQDGQIEVRHGHQDRLLEQVYRPLLTLYERMGRLVQGLQTGRIGHYLGYLLAGLMLGITVLKVTGQI